MTRDIKMQKYNPKSKRNTSAEPNLLTQLGSALVTLFKLIFLKKRPGRFNREEMLVKWNAIEILLQSGDQIHAAQAVVRADTYLDEVMKRVGSRGETFADRIKSLESKFSRDAYQQIWNAHKLRNQLAHQHLDISVNQARSALAAFRRGASQLGAF